MTRRTFVIAGCMGFFAGFAGAVDAQPQMVVVKTDKEPMVEGRFKANWASLEQEYKVPEWFRDAKFGMWAHWGPQCEAEHGDWYARSMYMPEHEDYAFHCKTYGHPSVFGFKDIIHQWKAENFNPDKIVALYKKAGAHYFMCLANHHDNFDLWNSKYQPWNSVAVGPHKDIVGGWAKACKANKLPLGVSIHANKSWSWYEAAQGADTKGPLAGVPYDGKLTKADGKGKWWDGLDPQDLYEQRRPRMPFVWDVWNSKAKPDQQFCDRFYNRTMDLLKNYKPDLIYWDDHDLPLWPASDAGMKLTANFYNMNPDGVIFAKGITEDAKKGCVWDIERGIPPDIQPLPWQTCSCIGSWHYDRRLYDNNGYKSAKKVIQMLVEIVSKNGNLLMNVPLRRDGMPDEKELQVVADLTAWMDVNGEGIFATRPYKVFGETALDAPVGVKGDARMTDSFNEGKKKDKTAGDKFFTQSKDGKTVYIFVMGIPEKASLIRTFKPSAGKVKDVALLGAPKIGWKQTEDGLLLDPPAEKPVSDAAICYKVSF